jgi:sigma-B regulation protein RsbU (phosphoserine phosphatase)
MCCSTQRAIARTSVRLKKWRRRSVPSSESPSIEDVDDLYESAPCGYVSLTPDGRIAKLNRTLAGWLGRAPQDLLARKFSDVLGFGARIAYETHIAPMLRMQGHVDEIAFELLDAAGAKTPVLASATEKRAADGRHLFTRITLFKAVDRRRYERSLVEARDEARTKMNAEHETAQLREQFIAVLGHDLRNPLAAISAGTDMLGKEALSERGRFIVNEMTKSLSRANDLIDDVLDFARGRLGDGLVLARDAKEPLTPVLDQVVSEVRTIVPQRVINARYDIREPLDCDRQRIGQLASNLISNAVAHGDPATPVELEAYTNEEMFVLSVTNGGVPIPPEVHAALFQPFVRGDAQRSQQGLGLGLYIAAEIAKAHDGTIVVSSNEKETRFTFTMASHQRS